MSESEDGFEMKFLGSVHTLLNPKEVILSVTQGNPTICPTNATSAPRAINSSAIAEMRITCPDPIDSEASARKTYLIVDKGMLRMVNWGNPQI